MFNLLPEKNRKIAWQKYEVRRLIVGFVLFFVVLVVAFLSLLPSYFFSNQKEAEIYSLSKDIIQSETAKKDEAVSNLITLANKKILFLKNFKETGAKQMIEYVVGAKVAGIKIISFSFVSKDASVGDLIVAGTAFDRDTLLVFKKNLEAVPGFQAVDLPVSNLAKDKDIPFSLKISIQK